MHKRKDETQDIYRGSEHDFEKDFTPQITQERLAKRQRDMRQAYLFSIFFGALAIVLAVMLVFLVIRNFLRSNALLNNRTTSETPSASVNTPDAESLWIMDYHQVAEKGPEEETGAKPLSARWVKNAANQIVSGQRALALKKTDEAIAHFQKALEIYPEIQELHGAMGTLYLQNEEYKPAAEHLEKAVQEKEIFDAVNNLGGAYLGLEEFDKAEKYLQRALELRPEDADCHRNLAVLYRKMKRDNEAVYHFEKYIDMRPGDLNAMQDYGLYLTKLGRWKEAADFLTKLTQEVTDVAPIYFLLAQVQVKNGQQDKAIDALKRGIPLVDPNLALAWMRREDFNAIRNASEFKALIDQLEAGSGISNNR